MLFYVYMLTELFLNGDNHKCSCYVKDLFTAALADANGIVILATTKYALRDKSLTPFSSI